MPLAWAKKVSKQYQKSIDQVLRRFLNGFGFSLERTEIGENGFVASFRNGKRYVSVSSSLYPTDYPYCFIVELGEGSGEFPESDWNAIALFVKTKEPPGVLYEVDPKHSDEAVRKKMLKIRSQLKKHALDFLENDLGEFRLLRAEQNSKRAPYQISTLDPSGKRVVTQDARSARLKKKFSRPGPVGPRRS